MSIEILWMLKIIITLTAFPFFIFFMVFVYIIVAHIIKQLNIIRKSLGLFTALVQFCSGEFIFKWMPNGGSSVVFRTLFAATIISIAVIASHYVVYWDIVHPFDIIKKNGWQFCGIYAAAYAAFYARFVSQWTYLSNLYNQIKNVEVSTIYNSGEKKANNEILYGWMSGFIEDAESLHLETKPIFATVILNWLEKYPPVGEKYCQFNPQTVLNGKNGHEGLENLK